MQFAFPHPLLPRKKRPHGERKGGGGDGKGSVREDEGFSVADLPRVVGSERSPRVGETVAWIYCLQRDNELQVWHDSVVAWSIAEAKKIFTSLVVPGVLRAFVILVFFVCVLVLAESARDRCQPAPSRSR